MEPEEVEQVVKSIGATKPAGAIDVDATQPLDQVVDELLRLTR